LVVRSSFFSLILCGHYGPEPTARNCAAPAVPELPGERAARGVRFVLAWDFCGRGVVRVADGALAAPRFGAGSICAAIAASRLSR
jgi:hypothetical protein